jgi:hypothetical protein
MKVITMSNEQKVTHKLSANMGAEVKGYATLMSEDEVFRTRG